MPEQPEVQAGGNGKNNFPELNTFLDTGTFDGAFTGQNIPSAIEKFIERGEKIEDLLLRSDFVDSDQQVAVVVGIAAATYFEDKQLKDMIMNFTSSTPSIGGKRIDILLQAVVGQIKNQEKRNSANKLREAIGLKPKESNVQN